MVNKLYRMHPGYWTPRPFAVNKDPYVKDWIESAEENMESFMPEYPEFRPFPKIPRLQRGCVITEKLDGTNALVYVSPDKDVFAGSRSRWLNGPGKADNFGFWQWVQENKEQLSWLGPGYHYGEWWGQGIQRGYGLKEKRFSLFNWHRWKEDRPPCCGVVQVICAGEFSKQTVDIALQRLREEGSISAPGFMSPEGIVVFHSQSKQLYKVLLENDEVSKTESASKEEWQGQVAGEEG